MLNLHVLRVALCGRSGKIGRGLTPEPAGMILKEYQKRTLVAVRELLER